MDVEGDIRIKVEPKDPEEKKTLVQTRDKLSQWFPIWMMYKLFLNKEVIQLFKACVYIFHSFFSACLRIT